MNERIGGPQSSDLFDTWAAKGSWWIDGAMNDSVSGELVYTGLASQGGLKLVTEEPPEYEQAFEDLFYAHPSGSASLWIYGKIADSIVVSARNAITANTLTRETVFHPDVVLTGDALVDDETRYSSTLIEVPGLSNFFAAGKGPSVSRPAPFGAIFQGLNVRLDFQNSQGNVIVVEPETPQPLDWFIAIAYAIQDMFSLLYGFSNCLLSQRINSLAGNELSVWYQLRRDVINPHPNASEMLTRYKSMKSDEFVTVAQNWFNSTDKFRDYFYLFRGNFAHPHPKARVNLIVFAQCMERFDDISRQAQPSPDMKADCKTVRKFIKATIVAEDRRQAFYRVLGFLSKPSQKERLKFQLSDLQSFAPLFHDQEEISNFVDCVVETRNCHVHGNSTKRMLDTMEQTVAVEGLKIACLLLTLKHLGVNQKAIQPMRIPGYRFWALYYPSVLSSGTLARRIVGASGHGYHVVEEVLHKCAFCESEVVRQSLRRDEETCRTRTICRQEADHRAESRGRCLRCKAIRIVQSSRGSFGEEIKAYCSTEGCGS